MAFIDLFVKSDETPDNKPIQNTKVKQTSDTPLKFPTQETQKTTQTEFTPSASGFGFGSSKVESTPAPSFGTTSAPITSAEATQEQINSAFQLYEQGFESLNQPGYDFFEYFKAISAGGIENASLYGMAFAMGRSMDGSITKEKLLSQSEFYLGEINKVYEDFNSKGIAKRDSVAVRKSNDNQNLVGELESIKEQIHALQVQQQDRESKLAGIDSKYSLELNEIEGKLSANRLAKDKIVNSIQAVKNGITINIKS